MRGTPWLGAIVLVLAACSGSGDAASVDRAADTTTPPPTTASPPITTTSATPPTTQPDAPPEPVFAPQVIVTGPEEVVFDWTTDRCEDEHIPDIAARAFRDADEQVQLIIGHYVNYRMIGPQLDEVATDCGGPMLVSDYDPDPAQFNDSEWIGSPYTLDGQTVYAVVHNEYRGDTHSAARPGQCPSMDRLTCLDTSLTMVVSTDGGDTYDDIRPAPDHLIATLPYTFDDEGVPSGLRQPSNVIQGPDDYFYVFSNISDYPDERQWVCAMRTDDLAEPSSWRFWNGTEFAGRFVNPYAEEAGRGTEKCAPLAFGQLSGGVQETVVFDESLGLYVMMGITNHPSTEAPNWGVYYSFSENLIDWTARELLLPLDITASVDDPLNDLFYAYPSVIDPDSTSRNFETSDGGAYLYLARFNAGGNSLDRDLLRWPIEFRTIEVRPPEWAFDADGDTLGWYAQNGLTSLEAVGGSLVMESVADDPYLASGPVRFPANYGRMTVRMRVSGDGSTVTGQVFFGSERAPDYTETKSVVFDVIADGEFHEYALDFSSTPGWEGFIVSLRLDPAPDAGRVIAVDRIWFPG